MKAHDSTGSTANAAIPIQTNAAPDRTFTKNLDQTITSDADTPMIPLTGVATISKDMINPMINNQARTLNRLLDFAGIANLTFDFAFVFAIVFFF